MNSQDRPVLVTSEINQQLPILIIDKKGQIGAALAEKLKNQFLIVLISSISPKETENILYIHYHKKIPMIPDNIYSHIFTIYNGEKETIDMLPSLLKKAEHIKAKVIF